MALLNQGDFPQSNEIWVSPKGKKKWCVAITIQGYDALAAAHLMILQMLNDLFSRFDDICDHHGVYHVDTIGDS
eukprot:209732-Pelagomonas_calceolata.AAC.1